jgi:hypothetical protein
MHVLHDFWQIMPNSEAIDQGPSVEQEALVTIAK